jgi:hydrogenase maturation protease
VSACIADAASRPPLDTSSTTAPSCDAAVIGCGNPARSDDGVGPQVIRALAQAKLGPRIRLLDAGTDGMAVMFAARGCEKLIIVDACRSGAAAGAVFEVPGGELARSYAPALTTHDFRWNHALHAGRMIFRDSFPDDVLVLLIEAQSVDFGIGLSAPVAAAATIVARRIQNILRARDRGRSAPR